MVSQARYEAKKAAAARTHWPDPSPDRTHCKVCGRAIHRSGRYWVHRNKPGAGRPRRPAPDTAAELARRWHHYNDLVAEHCSMRDQMLAQMAQSGMICHHIAEVLGISSAGVLYHLERIGVKLAPAYPQVFKRPPKPKAPKQRKRTRKTPPDSRIMLNKLAAQAPAPPPRRPTRAPQTESVLDRLAKRS